MLERLPLENNCPFTGAYECLNRIKFLYSELAESSPYDTRKHDQINELVISEYNKLRQEIVENFSNIYDVL